MQRSPDFASRTRDKAEPAEGPGRGQRQLLSVGSAPCHGSNGSNKDPRRDQGEALRALLAPGAMRGEEGQLRLHGEQAPRTSGNGRAQVFGLSAQPLASSRAVAVVELDLDGCRTDGGLPFLPCQPGLPVLQDPRGKDRARALARARAGLGAMAGEDVLHLFKGRAGRPLAAAALASEPEP